MTSTRIPPRRLAVYETVRALGRWATVAEIVAHSGLNYETCRKHVARLFHLGVLERKEDAYPIHYRVSGSAPQAELARLESVREAFTP